MSNIRDLQYRLCLMFAFQTVITHGKKDITDDAAKKIIELAKHMNEFCDLHMLKEMEDIETETHQ